MMEPIGWSRAASATPTHDIGPAYRGQPNQPAAPHTAPPMSKAKPEIPSRFRPADVQNHWPNGPKHNMIASNTRFKATNGENDMGTVSSVGGRNGDADVASTRAAMASGAVMGGCGVGSDRGGTNAIVSARQTGGGDSD